MLLYKYYSNINYALNDIKKGEVYLSSPESFNDGFEATVYDEDFAQYNITENLHILCLSPSFSNQSMWGVYANSEMGVCIGYDVPDYLLNNVRYTNEKITKTSIDEAITKAHVPQDVIIPIHNISIRKKSALIKSEDWLHEKEYRIILEEEDSELISKLGTEKQEFFVKLNAVVVYAGRRSKHNNSNFKELLKICYDKSIDVFEIKRGVYQRCLVKGKSIKYEELI